MHSQLHPAFTFITGTRPNVGAVEDILACFGQGVVSMLERVGLRIVTLVPSEQLADVSPALAAAGIAQDPAAVFIASEARIYVRCAVPLALGHAIGSAIDFALGRPSAHDPRIVSAYNAAVTCNAFLTPLARATPGSYVAEALRAFYRCDDPIVGWPAATPERLKQIDPAMYGLTVRLVNQIPLVVGCVAS
jgi:hypothetical protein